MSNLAHSVVDFNKRVLGIDQRIHGLLNESELILSKKCLQEELDEFSQAADQQDFIGQIDALIDLQYFAIGVMYKLGLTAEEITKCCDAVHQANMQKKLGVVAKRGDGSAADAVKPEGWIPPEERIGIILGE